MPTPISPAHAQFGRNLRAARQATGLSLEALAHQSGVSWSYIGHIERGTANPALTTILKLAQGTHTNPQTLLEGLQR